MYEEEIDTTHGEDSYAGVCAGCGRDMTNAEQSIENPTLCKECQERLEPDD